MTADRRYALALTTAFSAMETWGDMLVEEVRRTGRVSDTTLASFDRARAGVRRVIAEEQVRGLRRAHELDAREAA